MVFDKEHESSYIMRDVCHKTCRYVGSLKLHQCVHTGEYAYCCDLCNKTFSDTSNLKEMPLFKIRLCMIGRTVSVFYQMFVCVAL